MSPVPAFTLYMCSIHAHVPAEGLKITFLVLLKVPKSCSLCTMLESNGVADAVPSGMSHLQVSQMALSPAVPPRPPEFAVQK